MSNIFKIIEEIAEVLSEGECIDADGNRQLTLPILNNPNNGRNFQKEREQKQAEERKEKRSNAAKRGAETRKLNKEKKANAQVNALGLTFEDFLNIAEEHINGVSQKLIKRAAKHSLPLRQAKLNKAARIFQSKVNDLETSLEQNGIMPQFQISAAHKAGQDVETLQSKVKHAEDILKEAMIELLNVFEEKPINFKKEQIAKMVNDMMVSGETDSIRQTSDGNIIGPANIVNKLKGLKKERQEIDNSEEKDG